VAKPYREDTDREKVAWGVLIMLILLGIVVTSILQFFGGSHLWPIAFLASLVAVFIRYYIRACRKYP
jgi:uncharacterized membrane protein YjjP (DUF1212 family)